MRSKKFKKKSTKRPDALIGISLIAVAIVIFVGIFIAQNNAIEKKSLINKENFCAHELKESTTILIDHSDKLNAIQRAGLQARLWDIVENLPKNSHQIKIFSVDKVKENVLTPEVVLCNPGSEKEMGKYSENEKMVRKQYEEKFKKHLDETLNGILSEESASQSPIMEAVQSVAVTSFIGEKSKKIKKKLILVSDLLEHTSNFSVYGGVIVFEKYQTEEHWKSVKSDLNDVEVEIYFLHRDGELKLQNGKLRDFWIQFFENQGAKVIRFLPIEG